MKKLYCFLTVVLIFQFANAQKIIRTIVTAAPLYITSTFSISCELFDNSFTEYKKVQEINVPDLKGFERLLKRSKSIKRRSIDVRGKLTIYFDNKVHKMVCFDEFAVFFNGSRYFENKPLLQFLVKNKLVEN